MTEPLSPEEINEILGLPQLRTTTPVIDASPTNAIAVNLGINSRSSLTIYVVCQRCQKVILKYYTAGGTEGCSFIVPSEEFETPCESEGVEAPYHSQLILQWEEK